MDKKLTYVLENYALNHSLDISQFDIGYGLANRSKIRVVNKSGVYFDNKEDCESPDFVFVDYKGEQIPFLFSKEAQAEVITTNKDGSITINYDIIGSAFFLLSGWQEVISSQKDVYGRFPFKASIQKKLDIIERPIVDYYYEILSDVIKGAYKLNALERRFKKDKMITFISHDIDQCTTGWKEAGYHALRKMRLFGVLRIALNRLVGKDVWYNFDKILEYNKGRDIRAAFYFLTRKGINKKYNIMNADYDLKEDRFQKLFTTIRKADCEVGLQGSLETGLNKDRMFVDKELIGTEVSGNRCHFLLYDIGKLAGILSHSDIKYDNSTCFAEHIGFRHSTCSPFYYFDFEKGEISSSIGLPLVIMDRTLSQKKYMNVPQDECLTTCRNVILETAKFNGVLSILWHNHHFSEYKFEGWRNVLDQILDLVEEQGGRYRSGEEILKSLDRL